MSLINTLSYAEAAGYLKTAYDALSGAEAVRFFTAYPYMQSSMNIHLTRAAVIDGLDALTPLPIHLANNNIGNLVEMRSGFTLRGFNPLSTLTTQSGGQIWTNMITPKEIQQREEAGQIERLEKDQKKLHQSPLRTSLLRANMAERRRLLEEKRAAYRREELRRAQEEKEKRLGVARTKRKFPITAKKRLKKQEAAHTVTAERPAEMQASRQLWRRKKQKGF